MCAKEYQRAWNSRNKERIREGNVRRRSDPAKRQRYLRQQRQNWLKLYNLTPEGYDELLASQQGTCAICGEPGQVWAERNLHVDHDHDTHEVRGLLCGRCNVGLGFFGESIRTLTKAIAYLASPPAEQAKKARGA